MLSRWISLLVGLACLAIVQTGMAAPAVSVIPQPVHLEVRDGNLVFNSHSRIVADQAFQAAAQILAEKLSTATGRAWKVEPLDPASIPAGSVAIQGVAASDALGDEGYRLEVTAQGVRIEVASPAGAFYGCQTLRQLLPREIEREKPAAGVVWSVPLVRIVDRPRFSWRGMMLDSARHFQDKTVIKRYIDLLAYHKMNRLHWHLIDDQGWRVEIKKYPKLAEVAAWRPNRDAFLNRLPGKEDERYGGFYSQEDLREIVAYAAARHVTIVPEIEVPGHALAMLAAYPELSCTGGPFELGKQWIYKDVCCAGNEKTIQFLDDVLTEMVALFPSSWIHVGGDECPKIRWKACPKCQERIKAQGLRNEEELQSDFVRRVSKLLEAKGRRLVGWDEILEGGLAPGATVQAWRGMKAGVIAARQGHDVIASPTSHCYLDYTHENLSVQKSYSFEPIPDSLEAQFAPHILGVEGCMWLGNVSRKWLLRTGSVLPVAGIDAQVFPRIVALAEVGWSPKESRNWDDFKARLISHGPRLEELGVSFTVDPTVWGVSRAASQACPIFPAPKEYRDRGRVWPLGSADQTAIVLGGQASEPERYAAEQLQAHLERRTKRQYPILTESAVPATVRQVFLLGQRATNAWVDRLCGSQKIELSATVPGVDGFVIEMLQDNGQNPSGNSPTGSATNAGGGHVRRPQDGPRQVILVGGSNARGVIYGQDALFDLVHAGDKGPEVSMVSIRDWASISWRGRPHSVLAQHLVPGAMDAYARSRINFLDVRDDPRVKAGLYFPARKASMGFPAGLPIDKPQVKRVIDEGHRRGMFLYGTVSCGKIDAAKVSTVLGTFEELIALGVDGLWMSFDDTGAGAADAEIMSRVLELGRRHQMTGRKIAITPPVGDYEVIDRPFNRAGAAVPGMEGIQWYFTRVPCKADVAMASQIGLKGLPGWWHNLVDFGVEGGFLHNGDVLCTLRADDKPAYVNIQPLTKGWGKPTYEQLRDAAKYNDNVLLWAVCNGWPEEYEVGALGLWAWNPPGHDWTMLRKSVYRYVYGAGQADLVLEFDDRLSALKKLFHMPVWNFAPNLGWPCRLRKIADRPAALIQIDELAKLAKRIRAGALAETAIDPARLETIYLEPMDATLVYARKMTLLDYPEQWLETLKDRMCDRLDAGDNAGAEKILGGVRDKVFKQLETIETELRDLKGIREYTTYWRTHVTAVGAWKRDAAQRRLQREKARHGQPAKPAPAAAPVTPPNTSACLIVPVPKVYRDQGRRFPLLGPEEAAIVVGAKATEPERYAAEQLQVRIERRFKRRLPILDEGQIGDRVRQVFLLGQRTTNGWLDRLCREHSIDLGPKAPGEDGFVIEFLTDGPRQVVAVGGCNAPGVIYGQNALFDLIERRGERVDLVAASVRDWPSLRWRGRPHWRMRIHMAPGVLDSYARYRINFSDLRDSEAADGYAAMGFPPGFKIRVPATKQFIGEAHRRGMFLYGVVACGGLDDAKIPAVLGTFEELIGLGADGLWISFDDTGAGPATTEVMRRVLELGGRHQMTGGKIGITSPAGDYNVVDRPFNHAGAKVPGMAEARWFFTLPPCRKDFDATRRVGLVSLPAWWHNLFSIRAGFLYNANACQTLRTEGKPAYLDMQPLAAGWGRPKYENLRDAEKYTDTALLWGLYDGWPEEYQVGTFGIWAWNPAAHDWAQARRAVYRDVYGPSLAETALELDDKLAQLKLLFTAPDRDFGPKKGWPTKLVRVGDRPAALAILDEIAPLARRLREQAPAETAIDPARLETIYLEPIEATLAYARKMTMLDYPEQWLGGLEDVMCQYLEAGDEAAAGRLLAAIRDKVQSQLGPIQAELQGLQGIERYARFWQDRIMGLAPWKKAMAERQAAVRKAKEKKSAATAPAGADALVASSIRFHDGVEVTAVATGPSPSKRERLAVQELVEYLARITRKRLNCIEIADGKIPAGVIAVGKLACDGGLISKEELQPLARDGYVVKVANRRGAICGWRDLGTVYGVYALLGRLGVKFYAPDCEIVPEAAVAIPELALHVKPQYELRGFFKIDVYCGLQASMKLGATPADDQGNPADAGHPGNWVHTSDYLLPYSQYRKDHPEYFALQKDGRRLSRDMGKGFDVHLCLSNPDVRRITSQRMLELVEKQKDRSVFVVTQGDGFAWCQCERCKALDGAPGTMTDRLLDYVNELARAVGKQYPDKMIYTLAYTNATSPPPVRVLPEPNVRVAYCPYPARTGCHSHDLTCPKNRQGLEDLRGWLAKCPRQMHIFDYPRGYAWWYEPFGSFYAMARKMNYYAQAGVRGIYYCVAPENFRDLFIFVQCRLQWEPGANVEALVDEFMAAYYGKAAPAVREYFDYFHREIDQRPVHQMCEAPNPALVTAEYASHALAILRRAQEAVADDPARLARVDAEKFCVLWADVHQRNLTNGKLVADREEFARRLAEVVRIARAKKIERVGRNEQGLVPTWLSSVSPIKTASRPWHIDPAIDRLIAQPQTILP